MTDAEQRVQEAFGQIKAPKELVDGTLRAIEDLRVTEGAGTSGPVSSHDSEKTDVANRTASGRVSDTTFEAPAAGSAAELAPRFRVIRGRGRRRAWLAAACVVLALVGVIGVGAVRDYLQPTAYVGIDMNPSIELAVNRYDVVVQARGVNEDGQAVLDGVDVMFLPFEQALDKLTASSAFAAYACDDSLVEIAVTSDDEQQALQLCAQGDTCLAQSGHHGSCHVADSADRQAAAEAGMGVARYKAAEELLALDPGLTLEDCKSMSMRELRDHISACEGHGGNHEGADESAEGTQGQEGAGGGQGTQGGESANGQGQGAGSGSGAGQGNGNGQGAQGQGHGQGRGQGHRAGHADS